VRKFPPVTVSPEVVRELKIGAAGVAVLGGIGLADATIGDDVDFTAIYLAVIATIAWTSRLTVSIVGAVSALVASLGADVVAHPPDLGLVLVWNGAGGLAIFVGVAVVVSYARDERQELRRAATHDSLTHLPNRVLFLDRLENALAQSRRHPPGPSVLAIDLDGFKQVNDTYGHHAGDLVLVDTAARLRSCIRETDTCARFGGDEFAILLPFGGTEGSARVLSAIDRAFRAPFPIGGRDISLRASAGCAIAPTDGDDSITLLRIADERMYGAKSSGSAVTLSPGLGAEQPAEG
jgi:diguanylate cyclase (GGDEF)-like protein